MTGFLVRRADWPERLAETVRAARTRPFAWGRHDCALFACDCIAAMTDIDHAAEFRGRYRTAGGAARALRRIAGAASLPDLATRYLGETVPVVEAGRGDLVLLNFDPDGPCLGVVTGASAAFLGTDGLIFESVLTAIHAWKVD